MDPRDQFPDTARDKDDEEPNTPGGNVKTYSSLGTGAALTPPRGRFLRPASAASGRRPSAFGLSPHSASSGWSGPQDDDGDTESIADRLTSSPSPGSHVGRIDELDEADKSGESSPQSASKPTGAQNGDEDLDYSPDSDAEVDEQDKGKDNRKNLDEKLLLENEKLRIDRAELEKEVTLTEEQYENQSKEITELREAAEKSAEHAQQEIAELKKSKAKTDQELAESQAWVVELENEMSELPIRRELQKKLDKAELTWGDYYGDIQKKAGEIEKLRQEVEELVTAKLPLEQSLESSQRERKNMVGEMQRVQSWMQKVHEQQIKADEERLQECDDQFLELMDRRDADRYRADALMSGALRETTDDFLPPHSGSLKSGALQENLGDFLPSCPGSFASLPRSSSQHYSPASQASRPNSTANHSPSQQRSLPAASTPGLEDRDETIGSQRRTSRKVSAEGLKLLKPLPPIPQVLVSRPADRRYSEPSQRWNIPRNSSLLRRTVYADIRGAVSLPVIDESSSTNFLDITESGLGERIFCRTMSDSVTETQRKEILDDLQLQSSSCFTWDNIRKRVVVDSEPPKALQQTQTLPPNSSVVGQRMRRDGARFPAPIITKLDGSSTHSARRSARDSPLQAFAKVTEDAAFTRPSLSPRLPDTAEVTTATSRTIDPPPSPGLKRRRGGASSVTAQGSPVSINFQGEDTRSTGKSSGHKNSTILRPPPFPRTGYSPTTSDGSSGAPRPTSDDETEVSGNVVASASASIEQIMYQRLSQNSSRPATGASGNSLSPVHAVAGTGEPSGRASTMASESEPFLRPRPRQDESPKGMKTGEFTRQEGGVSGTDQLEANERTFSIECGNSCQDRPERHRRAREALSTLVNIAVIAASITLCMLALLDGYIKLSAFESVRVEIYTAAATAPTWAATSTSTMTMTMTATSISTSTITETQTEGQAEVETRFLQAATQVLTTTETVMETEFRPTTTTATTTQTLVETELQPLTTTLTSTETTTATTHQTCSCPLPVPVPPPPSYTTLTGPQLDTVAAKAKKRAAQMQRGVHRAYLGKTYWGWVPEVQKMIDIVEFKAMEVLMGGAWGMRAY